MPEPRDQRSPLRQTEDDTIKRNLVNLPGGVRLEGFASSTREKGRCLEAAGVSK
jgi:hypothetical protein